MFSVGVNVLTLAALFLLLVQAVEGVHGKPNASPGHAKCGNHDLVAKPVTSLLVLVPDSTKGKSRMRTVFVEKIE